METFWAIVVIWAAASSGFFAGVFWCGILRNSEDAPEQHQQGKRERERRIRNSKRGLENAERI